MPGSFAPDLSLRGMRDVRLDLALRAIEFDLLGLEPLVVGLDLPGLRVVRLDEREDGHGGGGAARDGREASHEFASRQRRVNVFVVEIDDAAIDCHGRRLYSQ